MTTGDGTADFKWGSTNIYTDPLDQIVSDGVRGAPDVGGLATRADDRRIDILLWHYQDDDVPGPTAQVHLTITGRVPGQQYQARTWRVDQRNGNAFTAWKTMGSPSKPNKEQLAALVRASRMSGRPVALLGEGPMTVERNLPLQGVELIEITPRLNHSRTRGLEP